LQVYYQKEEQSTKCPVHHEGNDVGGRELAVTKDSRRKHRISAVSFGEHKWNQRDEAEQQGEPAADRPASGGADQSVGYAAQADCAEHGAQRIEVRHRARITGFGHVPPRDDDDEDRQWQIDQEHPSPTRTGDEVAADEWPDRGGNSAKSRPRANGFATVLLDERSLDHGQAAGREQRTSDA